MLNSKDTPARILVVDDEGAIRHTVTKTLQRVGYKVDAVASAEEALELLDEGEFDVVLSDIRMDGLSGVELLTQVREKSPDVSVILMTGYATLGSAVESLRLGATDYLVKPSSSRDIRDSVARGVERTQGMRRRRRLLSMIQAGLDELNEGESEPAPQVSLQDVEMHAERPDLRPPAGSLAAMELGPLMLYPGRYQISLEDRTIDLTPTEFDLLMYLAAHRGRVVSCNELVREVRGYSVDEAEAREVIRPHVSNLRRKIKIGPNQVDLIVNVRGIGYRLSDIE